MKTKYIIGISTVVLLLIVIGYFLFRKKQNTAPIEIDSLDQALLDAQTQAYQQGTDDANKQRETRERAALLTGGFSEIGRVFGLKPFG